MMPGKFEGEREVDWCVLVFSASFKLPALRLSRSRLGYSCHLMPTVEEGAPGWKGGDLNGKIRSLIVRQTATPAPVPFPKIARSTDIDWPE
jgi:hypothetical protein